VGFKAIHVCGAIDYFDDLAEAMKGTNFSQVPGIWIDQASAFEAPPADVIVDLTSDLESKSLCSTLCSKRAARFISVVCGRTWTGVTTAQDSSVTPASLHATFGQEENPLLPVTRIAAGITLQEILLIAGDVDLAAPPEKEILYNVANEDRTGLPNERSWNDLRIEGATIEAVGAGGIGVHFLECFAPMLGEGCELRIFDGDVVGFENLPLQIAYSHEDVDRPKAEVIAERLEPICNRSLGLRPFAIPYDERRSDLSPPDLRVVMPDNFAARKYANDLSLADGVPLVEAGSSPLSAQQRTYYPTVTACLEHRIHDLAARAANETEKASCSQNRALTLPGTNMVIAGVLGAEAIRTLCPDVLGYPTCGTITYDTRATERFGIIDIRPPCTHPRP
jgi:adenylyltransferase/sulfurtransferase